MFPVAWGPLFGHNMAFSHRAMYKFLINVNVTLEHVALLFAYYECVTEITPTLRASDRVQAYSFVRRYYGNRFQFGRRPSHLF